MSAHPNRGRRTSASTPTPAEVQALRGERAVAVVAALVHTSVKSWMEFEAGTKRMHPAAYELCQIKLREYDGAKAEANA